MSETYSVVLSGSLVEGFELDQVKQNIATSFKLNEAQTDKLFCGKPVAIKRGIDQTLALKLSKHLQQLGADVEIKTIAAVKAAVVAPTQQPTIEEVPKPAAAVQKVKQEDQCCPRCGHEQPFAEVCGLCKMDLTLHIRRLERRAKVVANILRERAANG